MGALLSAFLWQSDGYIGLIPFFVAVLILVLERLLPPSVVRSWASLLFGLGTGLGVTALVAWVGGRLTPSEGVFFRVLIASAAGAFSAMGIWAFHYGTRGLFARAEPDAREPRSTKAYLLDTSVIIDGRIANVCRTGFLDGELLIPRFILKELQYIADSADTLRRNKGRRGLEVLGELQENPDLRVRILDDELDNISDVDAKLIALAKQLSASVLTNDYNLKSVAELEGVTVLNMNELANAVKPEVLQGEAMSIRVVREGKEPSQGIGYLDDGTMVVVDGGKYYLNQTISVEVTSVLQTSAGRMIFARIRDDHRRYEKSFHP